MLSGRSFTVLGAAGFVGQRVVARLRVGGAQVYAPERDDPALFTQPLGHVIYAAGLTADYLARPYDTVEAHVGLLARVLQQCRWDSLVYLSSTRLYDSLGAVDATESLRLLLDPTQPRHLYDLSKGLGESLCQTAGGGRARVARLACVYEGIADADGFLPALLRQVQGATAMQCITVASSPSFARDYVHVTDVVDGLIQIVLHGKQAVYNLASGCNVANVDLFDYIKRRWSCEIMPTLPSGVSAAPRICIDRMREEFGWQPRPLFDVLDALEEGSRC